jgi:membrane protein
VVLPYGDQIMALSGYLLPYLMMSAGFAFIYAYLPNTKVSIASAFIGGLVTAIIWKIMGWGIANFVANSATSMAIYSAFASIIILMVWIYLGWLVLLIGASVSFYHQNPQNLRVRREQILLSAKNNEKLAVNILYLVGDSYRKDSCPWNAQRLSEHMSVGLYLVEGMIDMLEKAGYLIRAVGDSGELFPRKPLESFSLSDLIRTIRSGNSIGVALSPADFDQQVDDFFQELDGATAKALENKTIKDLLS